MLKVAVTGGMGSGKSSVCRILKARRIPVLRADDLSRLIAEIDPGARRQIRSLLGREVYAPNGSLRRALIASRVFSHPPTLRKLEAILHPRVLRSVRTWFRSRQEAGTLVAAVEAALVFESGMDREVDIVVVVEAPRYARIERIRSRDRLPKAEILRRMDLQLNDRRRRERADIVLKNNGTLQSLRRRTEFLSRLLFHLSHQG